MAGVRCGDNSNNNDEGIDVRQSALTLFSLNKTSMTLNGDVLATFSCLLQLCLFVCLAVCSYLFIK